MHIKLLKNTEYFFLYFYFKTISKGYRSIGEHRLDIQLLTLFNVYALDFYSSLCVYFLVYFWDFVCC